MDPELTPDPPLRPGIAGWGLLVTLVAGFLVLQGYGIRVRASDEGLYFYAASLISQGHRPYHDFFLAHPPLRFVPMAALFAALGGFPFVALKWLSPAAAVGTALCLWGLLRESRGPTQLARQMAPVLAVAAFLFCEFTLKSAGYELGVFEGLFLCALAGLLLVRRHAALAGAASALSLLTSLPCAPLVLVLVLAGGAMTLPAPLRRRFLASLLLVLLAGHLLLLWLCGWSFVEQVYLFHLHKLRGPETVTRALMTFAQEAGGLLALAVAGFFLALRESERARRTAWLAAAGLLLQLLAVATRPTAFWYYLVPALLPAGVLVGLGGASAMGWAGSLRLAGSRCGGVALGLAAVVLGAATLSDAGSQLLRRIWPEPAGAAAAYETAAWRDAAPLGPVNDLVRRAFWVGGPLAGGALSRYLRLTMTPLDLEAAVALAQDWKHRNPATTLFGDPRVVPWVALSSGVPITGHVADLTDQRFAAGQAKAEDVVEMLRQAEAPLVFLSPAIQMLPPAVETHVRGTFHKVAEFSSAPRRWHELYAR